MSSSADAITKMKRSLRHLRWLASAVLCLGLALGQSGCGAGTESGDAPADSAAAAEAADTSKTEAKEEKAIKVDAAEVRRGQLVIPIYADGVIRTPRSAEIKAKIGGELVRVLVEDGDRVRAGQLLAQVDQREYEIQLEEARYNRFQALASIAAEADTYTVNHPALERFLEQRRELERRMQQGSLTREEFRAQLLELEVSALQEGAFRDEVYKQRTGLAEAALAEKRAQLNLENTEIRAPFAGEVDGLAVSPGEFVSVGSTICSIYNNDRLEAVVNVLEADLGNLTEGRPVLL
ncbi:MAG: biotin/lipoyl-binding protein, partial [Candidatus Eisenbacteria bacterium]|nr:biotin/lipoyl-binding protein [Candidatus Eisenbacteria bacterium]